MEFHVKHPTTAEENAPPSVEIRDGMSQLGSLCVVGNTGLDLTFFREFILNPEAIIQPVLTESTVTYQLRLKTNMKGE